MKKRDRQEDGEEQRELLTLNEPLVPTMHETNYMPLDSMVSQLINFL